MKFPDISKDEKEFEVSQEANLQKDNEIFTSFLNHYSKFETSEDK